MVTKFKNLNKKKIFAEIFIIITLIFLYSLISAFSYANYIVEDISSNVFRLHVIANSDSSADQNLKYLVKDKLINYMNTICSNISSKDEAIKIATKHINDFQVIAENVVHDNGYDYPINISIGNFIFPTKYYGDISLPAGYYDALRVEIGNASGQNWWCVMFPALCFIDVSNGIVPEESKKNLEDNMSDESYSIISKNDDINIHFKFKLIELFTESTTLFSKN